jgi:predicted aminopeptidase
VIHSAWFRSFASITLAALSLSACSTIGYYGHLAHGEYALLAAREPIARVIDNPSTDPKLRQRLELAEQARQFASDHLQLPHNGSYTKYADLHRPYAMWNVFAAREFSLDAIEQCFPIAGCVAYRGYYERERAESAARELRTNGFETWVGGVSAYSTLGYFDDPILNTMLRWDDDELVGTIFHELAHQLLYVKGDTEFNESFATFVQREGLRQWRQSRGLPAINDVRDRQTEQFDRLMIDLRDRLRALYSQPLDANAMRARKREEIERLRADYADLRHTQWNDKGVFDGWMDSEINNAKLLPFGLYYRFVPAFVRLFAHEENDWNRFFAAVNELARQSNDVRSKRLEGLSEKVKLN